MKTKQVVEFDDLTLVMIPPRRATNDKNAQEIKLANTDEPTTVSDELDVSFNIAQPNLVSVK